MRRALCALATALMIAPAHAAEEQAGTYLLSLGGIELAGEERIDRFAIKTWGVDIVALCRIPAGWRMEAGRSATPDGRLAGRASHGVAFADASGLKGLALVRLWDGREEQAREVQGAKVPATFAGSVRVAGRSERKLTQDMILLIPATVCPAPVLQAEDAD